MATLNQHFPRSAADAFWPSTEGQPKANTGVSISVTPPPKMLTVSLDDTAIRFVAFEGKRIVDWASVDMYGDDLAIPRAFRKYAGRFNRKIIDVPFYAPLVRFMDKPEVKRRFVDQVVRAETAATIPFDPSEVDMAWTVLDGPDRAKVMVTAVPKREVDAVIDLANLSNVKPSAIYSKAAALAFASGIPNGVVAHLSHDSADLVLVRDDLAKAVHRVSIPGSDDIDGSASVLAQAIDELTAFEVESIGTEGAREVDAVVLTGTMTTSEPVIHAVRAMLGRRIRSVSPRVWYPSGFPASLYAINVGLAIADWSARSSTWRRTEGVRMRPTDLLPERHRVRTFPKRSGQLASVSAAALVIMVSTAYGAGEARQGVAALEANVVALERQARVDAVQAARLNQEQAQVNSLIGQIEAITAVKSARQQGVDSSIDRIGAMTIDSPVKRVEPMDVSHTRGKVSITATATSVNQALAYAEELRASGLFTEVKVTDVSAAAGDGASGPVATVFTVNIDATYPYTDPNANPEGR